MYSNILSIKLFSGHSEYSISIIMTTAHMVTARQQTVNMTVTPIFTLMSKQKRSNSLSPWLSGLALPTARQFAVLRGLPCNTPIRVGFLT